MEYVTRDGILRFIKGIYGNNEDGVSELYSEMYDVVNAGYSCNGVSDDEFEYIADMIMEEYGEDDDY